MSEENNNRSIFNEAVMAIQRLGYSWQKCNEYSRHGRLDQWREELRVINRELSKYTPNVDNGDIIRKKITLIDESINSLSPHKRTALYKLLEKKELILRGLQELAGKGDAYYRDDLDDIDI